VSHPKCILCRCEDVTLEDFREAYQEGFSEFESLKRYTGVGTGFCQGKGCLGEAALELARLRGVTPAAIPLTTIRQPAEPLTFAELAALPILPGEHASEAQQTRPAPAEPKEGS
jgi:bacterioferritin-associated ferredoxin